MNIEYARLTPTPAFVRPENKSYFYIDQNHQLFFDLYTAKEKYYIDAWKKNEDAINHRKECFESKECDCGGEIRYISGYDFWGCSNYKEPGKHMSFSGLEPVFYDPFFSINTDWLTDIIKESGFHKKVKAKELLEFYESAGLNDLREKYGFSATTKRINSYIETNKRSKEQEAIALKYLQSKYIRVLYQQCITYKLQDKKETFCIPDFIYSDTNHVFVADAKLDFCNDEKMALYISLVQFILKEKGDARSVFGAHILYKIKQYNLPSPPSKYPLIYI